MGELFMPVPAIHEDDAEALGLPGRELRWLIARGAVPATHCSTCVIRVSPGDRSVLFRQGIVHMLHNTGSEEMKVVCFFAPPTGLEHHRMHEDVDFPD